MPYLKPRKTKKGWVLPKKRGGVHRSRKGKVVYFKTANKAKKAGRFITAIEHGWKPTKLPKQALDNIKKLKLR